MEHNPARLSTMRILPPELTGHCPQTCGVGVFLRSEERNMLPDFNRTVMARLEGASHHTGGAVSWAREGWAEMVRWDSPGGTIKDGWSRRHYAAALQKIDADYADIIEWVYLSDLPTISHQVAQ